MSNEIIKEGDYRDILSNLVPNSVDLVLTDPPYGISRETNFHTLKEERFHVNMEFDSDLAPDYNVLSSHILYYLRSGGTAIIWCDVWNISKLYEAMKESGFRVLRLIIWQKTNPVPLNHKVSYLTNSREMAVVGVKDKKGRFNTEYHNGVYNYPIPRHGGKRIHPTQKCIKLFMELIENHSIRGDLVVDPFLGSGTTAEAAIKTGRRFFGGDINRFYVEESKKRIGME